MLLTDISKKKKKQENKIMNNNKETKNEKFNRLAEKRLNDFDKTCRLIKNLYTNTVAYDYSKEDTKRVKKRLKQSLNETLEFIEKKENNKFKD